MTTGSYQESLVWNGSNQNLRVGIDGALLRPAESAWVAMTAETSEHVASGKLSVIDTREISAAPRSVDDEGIKKKKKVAQVEDSASEEAPVSETEQVIPQETTEDSIVPEESI